MPLARIVTRIPEGAASLADYLAQRGYTVEMVAPEAAADSVADLEITFEACTSQQALERAAELASSLDADVVVATGAIAKNAPQPGPGELPAVIANEVEEFHNSRLHRSAQTFRETIGDWRRQSTERFVAARRRLSSDSRAWRDKVVSAAKHGRVRAEKSIRQIWFLLRRGVSAASATIEAKFRQAQVQAAERTRTRTLEAEQRRERQRAEEERRSGEMARRRQQREQVAALEAAKLRAHNEPVQAASDRPYAIEPEPEEEALVTPIAASVLRHAARPQSRLVAYTRNRGRDWKMAFLGAAAASAVIMLISFRVVHRPLTQNDVEQNLPQGTVAAQPQPPTLMIPATVKAPPPPAVPERKTTQVASKPQPAPAPETQADDPDDYFDEVVVRHYPTHQAAKARTEEDGVKRISDLE